MTLPDLLIALSAPADVLERQHRADAFDAANLRGCVGVYWFPLRPVPDLAAGMRMAFGVVIPEDLSHLAVAKVLLLLETWANRQILAAADARAAYSGTAGPHRQYAHFDGRYAAVQDLLNRINAALVPHEGAPDEHGKPDRKLPAGPARKRP